MLYPHRCHGATRGLRIHHAMDDGHSPARHEDTRALALRPGSGSTPAALRTQLDPEPWKPPHLSAGFAVGWVLTTAVLGTITAIWLVGMVFSVVLLFLGQGGLGGALAFAITGVLLGRGWVGMGQTIRSRLRRRDLTDPAALPPMFWTLSPTLQRLVRYTRGLRISVGDPELTTPEIDREMFEWIADMAALPPEDLGRLAELGLVPSQLREQLVASREQEDARERERLASLVQPRDHHWTARPTAPTRHTALVRHPSHRERALAVLDRFEHEVLQPGADPFRGGRARRSPE